MELNVGDFVLADVQNISVYGTIVNDSEQDCLSILSLDADIKIPVNYCNKVSKLTGIDRCKLGYSFIKIFINNLRRG